ncbi:MAG TPA: Gfo/Idh/MocA family oxidoreductase [Vicinamibacterales bacterium]|nr:Gfo/Idh/MocA family oxidoreductase [Vicinamibacterales bacterium]
MSALRVGVIGVGHLGKHHARLLGALPGVTLVAAVDLDLAKARAATADSGAEALTNSRDLLGGVDAVTIAVPTAAHLEVARPFLESGVHVLVEKPMTATLDEADEMIRLAGQSGALLMAGHTERFNPAVQAALPELRAPKFVEVHRMSGFPERSLDIDVVFDVMIHDLDIILAVDRSEVLSVDAIGVPVLTPKVDIANARIRFASGCVANITASRISRDKVRKVRFFDRDMYISVDYAAQELEIWRLRPRPGERPAIEGGPVPVTSDEPLRQELLDFVAAIAGKRAPRVTGEDGRRALALATRVAEAIARG